MASVTRRFLGRTMKDVTGVTAEDLRGETPVPRIVPDPPSEPFEAPTCKVICVASGKGGTGKTVISTNLAVSLARQGLDVLLFDADLGLANAHVLLGISPTHDISSVVSGQKKLDEVVVECQAGVKLISGGSGFSDLAELKDWQVRNLADQLRICEDKADIIIVDLSAGISPQVMRFLAGAHDVIIVTTPDVTALLDAYATLKSMSRERESFEVKVIVNRARSEGEAMAAFEKLREVAGRHLPGATVRLFDWLPHNWYIQNSVNMRQPVVLLHPKSFVTRSFAEMAGRIRVEHDEWKRSAAGADGGAGPSGQVISFARRLARLVFK
jgi:flagellar biosynthesis protein FlhG